MKLQESSHSGENPRDSLAIVGVSMGNSRFDQSYITKLLARLKEDNYAGIGIMLPDVPAESTLEALGNSPEKARRKVRLAFSSLIHKCRRSIDELGLSDIKLITWDSRRGKIGQGINQVELIDNLQDDISYKNFYREMKELYENDVTFRDDVRAATGNVIVGTEAKIDTGKDFLLQELAFILNAADILAVPKSTYVYHALMPVLQRLYKGEYQFTPPANTGYAVYN